jgi:3-deoxy-7-phosphoheptulonate synthase
MIITLEGTADADQLMKIVEQVVQRFPEVTPRLHQFNGTAHQVNEIHLIGDTKQVPLEPLAGLPGVQSVVRVSKKYRMIGRPPPEMTPADQHGAGSRTEQAQPSGFQYNGVQLDDTRVNIFAGLCAVDTREHVDQMMKALAEHGILTTRMGVYKPRTSPYDFQGHGKECLPWLFDLAGKHGMKIVTMEVCDERHIEEVYEALEKAGRPTGVMLQAGTRNAQNFELLKHLGQQQEFPVLFKRGMGITLEESLNACEYIASEGNSNIVFCLRGVKSGLADPHRNMVDFALVPVVRRRTRLPVCIDPSHSVGNLRKAPDGVPDLLHATGQGIIAGASMVLIEFHPNPMAALCDGHQALTPDQIPQLLDYVKHVRAAYDAVTSLGI